MMELSAPAHLRRHEDVLSHVVVNLAGTCQAGALRVRLNRSESAPLAQFAKKLAMFATLLQRLASCRSLR